ncbi:Hint domain-containing protein [Paracoccus aminophilus]|uniref:Hemolysin-type calcium-binding protein n=1 Tax=Paracoccus aminophilus JCM 7686 TaxID=1367847 RepID=S5YIQ8_PARAH|nr:Hint domain-containing protein [Paracoccus aminophilus]AGT11358.1 hemolysin-type calcium-binding protein [Paracoccus aminophilus JCM 7686]
MSYIIDFPRGTLTGDANNGYDLNFDPSRGGAKFSNTFGSSTEVNKFDVANDASGPGTLATGDYVAPIVNNNPVPSKYIGKADISFESVGSTQNGGVFSGLSVTFKIDTISASLIQTDAGALKLLAPDQFSKDDVYVTATLTFKGQTITVHAKHKDIVEALANEAEKVALTNPDFREVSDHVWDNDSIYIATIDNSRPSAPITVNIRETHEIPDKEIGDILCFAAGTLIATANGEIAIENLRVGDLVLTKDHGPQPIRWIGSTKLSAKDLAKHEKLRPVRIAAGALGAGFPASDLSVSPQHRVLVRSRIAEKLFGTDEVLVAAKQLLQIEGINIATDLAEVEYFHMLFDQHEVVLANGTETESLYTGPMALSTVSPEARAEIFALFPELKDRDYSPSTARVLISGRQARKLVVRHIQNSKPLVAAA